MNNHKYIVNIVQAIYLYEEYNCYASLKRLKRYCDSRPFDFPNIPLTFWVMQSKIVCLTHDHDINELYKIEKSVKNIIKDRHIDFNQKRLYNVLLVDIYLIFIKNFQCEKAIYGDYVMRSFPRLMKSLEVFRKNIDTEKALLSSLSSNKILKTLVDIETIYGDSNSFTFRKSISDHQRRSNSRISDVLDINSLFSSPDKSIHDLDEQM